MTEACELSGFYSASAGFDDDWSLTFPSQINLYAAVRAQSWINGEHHNVCRKMRPVSKLKMKPVYKFTSDRNEESRKASDVRDH